MEDNIIFEFRIHYDTKENGNICILGDNDDFGNWKDPKFNLKWTNGNIWIGEYSMNKNNKDIAYKFVHNNNNNFNWENCPNRILSKNPQHLKNLKIENGKYILEQQWDKFSIIFSLYHQIQSPNSFVSILGNEDFLGNWNKDKIYEFKMNLEKDENYKDVWRKKIDVLNQDKERKSMEIEYKYLICNDNNNKNYEKGTYNRYVKIFFSKDNINDEDKFFLLTNPKEYKLLINSIIEIEDSNLKAN